MQISRIDFKNFHGQTKRVDIDTNLIYLCGNNGRGKSTILQAAQLALLGYIPGYGKKVSDIFRHATDKQMSVKVVFDNGYSIERVYTKTSKSIDTDVICNPTEFDVKDVICNIELPIFNFASLLDMTANQLKAWFINTLFGSDTPIEWDSILTDAMPDNIVDVEDIKAEILDYINTNELSTLDKVSDVNAFIKSLKSEKNGELTRLSSTLQTLVYYDDIPSDATVEDIRAKYDRIREIHNKLIEVNKNKDNIMRIANRLKDECAEVLDGNATEYKKQLDNMIDENVEFHNVISNIKSEIDEAEREIHVNHEMLKRLSKLDGVCPITGEKCDTVKSDDTEVQKINKAIDELSAKVSKLNSQRCELEETYDNACRVIKHMQSKWQLYLDLIAQLENINLTNSPANLSAECDMYDISDCITIENKCMEDIQHITANEAYTKMHDSVLDEKYKIETSLEILKIYEKLTGPNGIASSMNVSRFAELATDVNVILHQITDYNNNVVFEISENANSFSFGWKHPDDQYVPYELLSSGEKCMFNIALMLSILNRLDTPIKLILADDIFDHLDKKNIDKLFNYVYNNHETQFIFAGVNDINKRFKESVIRL